MCKSITRAARVYFLPQVDSQFLLLQAKQNRVILQLAICNSVIFSSSTEFELKVF